MFENLTGKLGNVLDGLKKRGSLKEEDVLLALRDIRTALLEADVALPVVKEFIDKVRGEAIGEKVLRSITPGQQVVKIVHDALVETLGHENAELNLAAQPPAVILMAGLQGSGKTTSAGKLAKFITGKLRKKVLLASLDVYRPAAQEQLEILGRQVNIASLPIVAGEKPLDIAKRALNAAKLEGYDVLILDSAGRLSIDDDLMAELAAVRDLAKPIETLLVADALTGQDAVVTAENFNNRIGITGIILTRIDGDARGGAALSMRAVTQRPIKFLGTGEQMDALQPFDAQRIAGRILDMGDIVSLVEKAAENIKLEDAKKAAEKLASGNFDLDDYLSQLRQMQKMGGLSGLMSMMPGVGKIKSAMQGAGLDDGILKHHEAIILSMTKKERAKPDLLNASRRKRIAAGSGTTVQQVNQVLKQFQDMQTMMKRMKKLGGKGMMRSLSGLLGGGAMGEMEEMAKNMQASGGHGILGPNPFAEK
ncbi:MAG: signal recognition particle protein [Alphaproteobacteria bacterium]|nr:signal recognition particle protein [Alphaproteobacteria bacterium]MDE2336966.1 signal recognition particle protein [Alphaproteobacteria bacterium]